MRRIRLVIASLAVSAALMVGTTATTGAYGGGADHDMWQVGISFNCNNADFCGANLGGFWAWAEFDRSADGTATWGDVEGSGCFHTVGGGGGAGAVHVSVEIESWTIEPGSRGDRELDDRAGVGRTTDVLREWRGDGLLQGDQHDLRHYALRYRRPRRAGSLLRR